MKKITIFILLIILFTVANAFSDTHTAASCSYADVNTMVNGSGNAAAGDTVIIPPGSCTWTSTLTIDKALTLQGSGVASTIITHNNSYNPLISISPTTATDFIRVTGIYFENTNYVGTTRPDVVTGANSTNFRIDHCTFHLGKEAVSIGGMFRYRSNGVIDSNTFLDVDLAIRVADYADYYNASPSTNSWGRTIAMGTADSVFIENNTFTVTNRASCNQLNEAVYHNNGGRSTVRYNTFNNACELGVDTTIDAHGLGGCDRGTVKTEFYNNAFTFHSIAYWMHLRGGTHLVYNNTMTTTTGTPAIRLRNEQQEAAVGGYDDEWPSHDQIFNSFFWDNTVNGSAVTFTVQGNFIRENYEYFLHAPADSGGKSTFGGSPGASNDYCTGSGTATLWQGGTTSYPCCTGVGTGTCDMTFSASGANAYYPYTAYTCPHPITGLAEGCTAGTVGTAGYNTGADSTAPTCSWAIDTTGLIATGTCTESVDAVTKTGLSFTGSVTGAIAATYKDGMPGLNPRFDLGSEVQQSDTVTATYATPGTGIKDAAGNALANFSGASVFNGSTKTTPPTYAVTINKTGTGCTITSSPSGANCGETCSVTVDSGTVVTLGGYLENGWASITYGGDCAANGTVTVNAAKTCTATCTQVYLFQ